MTLLFFGISWWQTRELPAGSETPGLSASLATLEGTPFAWGAPTSPAKVTLVYAFAPWCGVCKMSSSNLRWLAQLFDAASVRIVPLALAFDKPEDVRIYAAEHPFPSPVVLGDEGTQRALRIDAFPTYFLMDRDLKIQHASVGYSTFLGMLARTLLALTIG